ncbi:histidine--tRNA ligase [Candidatus Woesebacteria bacterium]|nr:histidine--tRNA ligase [Candidatus Woesebacteria bacterium]
MSQSDQKLQTLKGFRDFLPAEKRKRDWAISQLKKVFEQYGFDPIETPTVEYQAVLLGKYGEEAEKLMYTFEDHGKRKVGLRYDQTVPTARFLSQHSHKLPRYFRRYQIQNVFRAENTQAGRFREFLQCDCDVFGSESTIADAEILAVFYRAYVALGISSFEIKLNDRTVLFDKLTPFATESVSVLSIIQSIDKIDKIKEQGVLAELESKGISQDKGKQLIEALQSAKPSESLEEIIDHAVALDVPRKALVFNPFLARGLDYYTGLIFEGVIPEYGAGSVGAGGRYDHLISSLGGPEIPAVGFAIGFDRTIEALEALAILPDLEASSHVLVTVFSHELTAESLKAAAAIRTNGINVEVYPVEDKLGKQIKYADDKKIPFVVIIGPDEAEKNIVSVKNMKTGEEKKGSIEEVVHTLSS